MQDSFYRKNLAKLQSSKWSKSRMNWSVSLGRTGLAGLTAEHHVVSVRFSVSARKGRCIGVQAGQNNGHSQNEQLNGEFHFLSSFGLRLRFVG